MRLIDADKLRAQIEVHEIQTRFTLTDYENGYNTGLDKAEDEVDLAETVKAIPVDWIGEYLAWLKDIGGYGLSDAKAIQSMLIKWKMEHTDGCGPDYCDINFGGGTKA